MIILRGVEAQNFWKVIEREKMEVIDRSRSQAVTEHLVPMLENTVTYIAVVLKCGGCETIKTRDVIRRSFTVAAP